MSLTASIPPRYLLDIRQTTSSDDMEECLSSRTHVNIQHNRTKQNRSKFHVELQASEDITPHHIETTLTRSTEPAHEVSIQTTGFQVYQSTNRSTHRPTDPPTYRLSLPTAYLHQPSVSTVTVHETGMNLRAHGT